MMPAVTATPASISARQANPAARAADAVSW